MLSQLGTMVIVTRVILVSVFNLFFDALISDVRGTPRNETNMTDNTTLKNSSSLECSGPIENPLCDMNEAIIPPSRDPCKDPTANCPQPEVVP